MARTSGSHSKPLGHTTLQPPSLLAASHSLATSFLSFCLGRSRSRSSRNRKSYLERPCTRATSPTAPGSPGGPSPCGTRLYLSQVRHQTVSSDRDQYITSCVISYKIHFAAVCPSVSVVESLSSSVRGFCADGFSKEFHCTLSFRLLLRGPNCSGSGRPDQ